MTKDAQNALKRIMERYADNCRFIITCNDRHKIINPLMSRCANYNFKRLNNKDMKYILCEILAKEDIKTHSDVELDKFITYLQGDLRRGLNELQASSASKRTLQYQIDMNMKPYSEIIKMINENYYENALEKVHKLIYDSTDMKTICINLHTTVLETESDSNYKFKMLRIIGETEWRSNNMNPKVLASWMVGQMIK